MSAASFSSRDDHLLQAALGLVDAARVTDVLDKLRPALKVLPAVRFAGISTLDEERGIVRRHLLHIRPPARNPAPADVPVQHSTLATLIATQDCHTTLSLELDQAPPELRALAVGGVERLLLAPLRLRSRLIGALFVGLDAQRLADADRGYLRRLARIASPAIWNTFTSERFARGDRRRDSLIHLMTALNASRETDSIIAAARAALDSLQTNAPCAVDLLDDDRRTVRSYDAGGRPEQRRDPLPEPAVLPFAGSTVEWLIHHPHTYESPDLRQTTRLPLDDRLRDAGVRRYVLTPMIAHGRVIGALLVGATDPHPPLRIDVWLYETIALQVGLAIENTRQFRRLQEASEKLAQQNIYLREEIRTEQVHGQIIGRSAALQKVRQAIARVARTDTTVLITGETGVGKELVARAIHEAGSRADKPMVKVNCAAIPEAMVESELFGHERGAFTSAVAQRIGRFELANDSTLFLDEVGELPLAVQAKLLRVLQDGEFERVGGSKTRRSNARIVAATNRDLLAAVTARTFRRDLYYRLSVFPIHVPTLQQRTDDIPLLVEEFMGYFGRRMGKHFEAIDPDSLECLMHRPWPGNIRELRHVIERAMILCDPPILTIPSAEKTPSNTPPHEPDIDGDILRPLHEIEARYIERVLSATHWVVEGPRGAARILGLHPSTLRSRMKRLGLARARYHPR